MTPDAERARALEPFGYTVPAGAVSGACGPCTVGTFFGVSLWPLPGAAMASPRFAF